MKTVNWLVAIFVFFISNAAIARSPVPVENFLNQPAVTASGNVLSVEQIDAAIRAAAGQKNWTIVKTTSGAMIASYAWKANKHMISVEISVTPGQYTLEYNNSINMNYSISNGRYGIPEGQPIIHPYYNRFVNELRDSIRVELRKY